MQKEVEGLKPKEEQPLPKRDKKGRYLKGECGNRKGRVPKFKFISQIIKDICKEREINISMELRGEDQRSVKKRFHAIADKDSSFSHLIATKLVQKALSGDMRALTEVMDRTEGKPKAFIQHSGSISSELTPEQLAKLTDKELAQLEAIHKKFQTEEEVDST